MFFLVLESRKISTKQTILTPGNGIKQAHLNNGIENFNNH